MTPTAFLGAHSGFSFLSGVGHVPEIVARAKALGYTHLALADLNRMSGLVAFYLECKAQGIHPILGVELRESLPAWFSAPGSSPESLARARSSEPGTQTQTQTPSLIALAARGDGYGDLCELSTWRQMHRMPPPGSGEGRSIDPFSLAAVCRQPWPDLVFLSESPEVLDLLRRGPNRDRVHGALIRHSPEARARGRVLEEYCDREGIPLVAWGDAWFPRPEDHELHRVLRAIDLNSTLSRLRPGERAPEGAWMRPPDGRHGMTDLFDMRPDALANAEALAARCEARPPMNGWVMPRIDVPEGQTPEGVLAARARAGLRENYGGKPEFARAAEIQEMELGVINKLGYASYFLMVQEVYQEAGRIFGDEYRRPKDCSLLRGSAANSLTFYNLGVGRLDPIEHDLYFQRFLNEDRASPPDADLDFGWDERERMLDHMVARFGRGRVAVTCTFQHFRFKAAFREAAKVFGYAEEEVTAVLEARDSKERRRDDAAIRMLEGWAARLKGRPRFLGQHPGGLIVTNGPIWRHVGCEWSASTPLGASGKGRLITQVDMHSGIDELGLIKFDLLGNGSLSVLRDALGDIRRQGFPDPEVWDLRKCYADEKANALMNSGNLRGVFYLESPAQMRLNMKADVRTFDEVIVTSSLIRPAGTAYAKTYVERHRKHKRGIKDWEFLHPALEPILGDTHDVCAFQEDVTKICHEVAGLSYKRADAVRKQMNSQHDGPLSTPELRALSEEFVAGCIRHRGLTRAQADELWRRVASFTGFSFCKSHSASYAQLSYQCVWLKAHYPAEFLAAVISNNHGFYRREVYLNEARRLGLGIAPLDVNRCERKFVGEGGGRESGVGSREGNGEGSGVGVIHPGLLHLRGFSAVTGEALERSRREDGPFRDLEDFLRRVPAGRQETENLILAGAFDGFGMTHPELLFHLDGIYASVSMRGGKEPELFGEARGSEELRRSLRSEDYTLMDRCLNEKRLFGYMLSGNPLEVLDLHPEARDAVPAAELGRRKGRRVKVFGHYVTERRHRVAKSGRLMQFLTLEDRSGTVDVIFWPDMLDRWEEQLLEGGPFAVWGNVTEEWDAFSLEADRVLPVQYTPNLLSFDLASARLRASQAVWAGEERAYA